MARDGSLFSRCQKSPALVTVMATGLVPCLSSFSTICFYWVMIDPTSVSLSLSQLVKALAVPTCSGAIAPES